MGSAPLPGQAAGPPVGLEANRAPIVIARLNADAAVWRFKADVMAHVRSIEQQYWSLAQQHVQLWSSREGGRTGPRDPQPRTGRAGRRQGNRGRRRGSSAAAGTVQSRPRHQDLGRDHHRTPVAQHPGFAARRQPPHRPGDAADRGSARTRLGFELGPDAHVPARHRPAAASGPDRRASAPCRPQPVAARS